MDDGVIKYNKAKALAACDSVSALLKGGQCGMSDIANVTPYASQVCLIWQLTRKLVQRPLYEKVSSMDSFQGHKMESVVFSAV